MPTFRKNLLVGLTVLVALILLGVMIIKFGDAPARLLRPSRTAVRFQSARADGLSVGSNITYKGVGVGTVESIVLSDDEGTVFIGARVDAGKLPGNAVGKIRSQLVGGGSSISLELPGTDAPKGKLKADDLIPADFLGVDVLPAAIGDLAESLRQTVEEIHRSHLTDNVNQTIKAARDTAAATTKLLESVQRITDDPKMRDDLRGALAGVRSAAESANRIGTNLEQFTRRLDKIGSDVEGLTAKTSTNVDTLSRSLNDRLEQVSKLLDGFRAITDKVNKGQGTAGMLVNDAKLYESLVDVSKELAGTVREVKLLVLQIEQEGFHFHVGGK